MPIEEWSRRLFKDRVNFINDLSSSEIQALIADQDLKVLQCASPVDSHTWDLLNNEFFIHRPEVQLRVF
jgi:hypothetical protein